MQAGHPLKPFEPTALAEHRQVRTRPLRRSLARALAAHRVPAQEPRRLRIERGAVAVRPVQAGGNEGLLRQLNACA